MTRIFLIVGLLTLSLGIPFNVHYDLLRSKGVDNINYKASSVTVDYATFSELGTVTYGELSPPLALIEKWQSRGKKVYAGIRVEGTGWEKVFDSELSQEIAIISIIELVNLYGFEGVTLELKTFFVNPFHLKHFLLSLKVALKGRFLILNGPGIMYHRGRPRPTETQWETSGWNYLYPLLEQGMDIYQIDSSGWMDGVTPKQVDFYKAYLMQWSNIETPFCTQCTIFPLSPDLTKVSLGISATNGGPYTPPQQQLVQTVQQVKTFNVGAMFIDNSFSDSSGNYRLSSILDTEELPDPYLPQKNMS